MTFNWSSVAQSAYEAYCVVARSDVSMLSVPDWEDLPPRLQEAWREAVKEACRRQTPAVTEEE